MNVNQSDRCALVSGLNVPIGCAATETLLVFGLEQQGRGPGRTTILLLGCCATTQRVLLLLVSRSRFENRPAGTSCASNFVADDVLSQDMSAARALVWSWTPTKCSAMLVIPLTALATAWQRLGQGLWRRLPRGGLWRLVEEASIGEDGVLTYPDDQQVSFYGQQGECD